MIDFIDYDEKHYKFISYVLNYSLVSEDKFDESKFFSEAFAKKIIKFYKIKLIISDNIRIGIRLYHGKKFFTLLLSFAYINKLIDIRHLKLLGVISKKLNRNKILKFIQIKFPKKKINNIDLSNKINRVGYNPLSKKNILILGPYKRNKEIISFIKNDGFNVFSSQEKEFYKKIDLSKIEFIISSGYTFRVPNVIIKKFNKRIINLHATFLPWGKGIGNYFFSSLKFEPLGLSIHLIKEKFDIGEIICRKLLKPKTNHTTRTYYKYSLNELKKYFIKNWPSIKKKNFITHSQNNLSKGLNIRYFSRLDFEKLVSKLPLGYDTKLVDLSVVGIIVNHNVHEKTKIANLIDN